MKQILLIIILVILTCAIELKPYDIKSAKGDKIEVTIDGAVRNKGTVEMDLYASEQELLDLAEPTDNADLTGINPNTILKDKDHIYIPEISNDVNAVTSKVSINTADADQLTTLKGIGIKTAEKIIAYRNENGLFQSLEDLMKVSGIKQARFDAIKDFISL